GGSLRGEALRGLPVARAYVGGGLDRTRFERWGEQNNGARLARTGLAHEGSLQLGIARLYDSRLPSARGRSGYSANPCPGRGSKLLTCNARLLAVRTWLTRICATRSGSMLAAMIALNSPAAASNRCAAQLLEPAPM